MASETSELTFVRCPSCRSLVPASAARCRICNNPLEGTSKADSGDASRAPGRVRQKTITASAEELLQGTGLGGEPAPFQPEPTQGFGGAPVGDSGGHEVADPLADFLQEFEEASPAISAPPPSQEIPAAANDDDDDLDSFLDDFDTFTPTPEPVEEPVRQPMAPPPVQNPPEPERTQYVSSAPASPSPAAHDPFDLDNDPLGEFMTEADDDFDLDVAPEPVREFAAPVAPVEPEPRYEPEPLREPEPVAPSRQERPQRAERPAAPAPHQQRDPSRHEHRQARPAQDERGRSGRDSRQGGDHAGGGDRREARRENHKQERRREEPRREPQQHRPRHEERRNDREPQRAEAPVAGPKTGKMRPGRLFGWLVSFESPDGRSIELREGKFFITGSSIRGTDLVIEDPSISTPHALMSISGEHGLLLQDLMSERGVYVRAGERGQYKREDGVVQLKHGEWVRFGDVEFLLTVVPGGDK